MPYTILPDGTIKADTLDETLAYLAERNRRARASASEKTSDEPSTPGSAAAAEANRDPWTAFVALASVATMKERRRFLSLLKVNNGKHLGREDLRTKLGLKSNGTVGGIASGMSKAAAKVGLDFAQVLVADPHGYKAGPLLRHHDLPWNGDGTMQK